MDKQTREHKFRSLQDTKKPHFFLIILRATVWLLHLPHLSKFRKVWSTYKVGGVRLCWHRAVIRFAQREYKYNPDRNQLSLRQSKYLFENCPDKPIISIVVPIYKVSHEWLGRCINSVYHQHYNNWELILVDDASKHKDLRQFVDKWVSKDNRIRVYCLERNFGIALATNFGIKQAKGHFIGFLEHDDELTPDALTWVIWAISKNPDALWLYSDEDLISTAGKCSNPHFKPDYSPEFLLSNMFTCHFSVYSAEVLAKVGYLRDGFDGSQDHDLALRLSEIIPREKIVHIPRVLYHWRTIPNSTAIGIEAKPKAPSAGRKAVAEALQRRGLKAKVSSYELCPTIYQIEFEPSEFPNVSIIIPTKNALSLTQRCIDSVRKHTKYPNFKIIVIDNASDDPELLKYLKREQSENRIKLVRYNRPFNHSEMNNIAVASIDSEFILFMNNDVEIISEKWLEQLIAVAQLDKSIAVVGGLLLYPNQKVQHGGIILWLNGTAGHAHRFVDSRSKGYFGRLHAIQEFSGITAALSLVRRSAFELVGGFNAERYPTSYNDVDFCIRLGRSGFRCIYNPMVRAIHYESKTRPITSDELIYRERLKEDHVDIMNRDPFYNPNLACGNEQFCGFRHFPVEDQITELSLVTQRLPD